MSTLTRERPADQAQNSPEQAPEAADRRTLPLPSWKGLLAAGILGAFFLAGLWSVIELRINIATMIDSWQNAVNFMNRALPLNFPPPGELLHGTVMTLAIVVFATALAIVLSIPVALLAARNTCWSKPVRGAARALIVLMRAMPELILAIFFIRVFGWGMGAVAGVLALGLHSVGMLGRMYADAIEDHDDGPREALETAGANRYQQILGSTLPGILPAIIAHGLHRFDINLRASVILGWVGVQGLGDDLSTALSVGNYSRGMALGLVILVLCILVELLSGHLRMKLMGRSEPSRFGILWLLGKLRGRYATRGVNHLEGPNHGSVTIPPWDAQRVSRFTYIGLTGVIVAVSILYSDFDLLGFLSGLGDVPRVLGQFFPPSDGDIRQTIFEQLLLTLQIALAATFLGAILALPVGALAARNVAPNNTVVQIFRTVIVVTRGIPELILAILLIVIMGMGAVAGTLALAIGAMGLLSKLVADSLEETDIRVQDALSASGARPRQVFFAATIRQAAPAMIAHIFYQLDVNFRSATLLGIVGAGGIGFQLEMARRTLSFEVITYLLLLVIAVVLILEAISVLLRNLVR